MLYKGEQVYNDFIVSDQQYSFGMWDVLSPVLSHMPMAPPRPPPYISLDPGDIIQPSQRKAPSPKKKGLLHYAPLLWLVVLLIAPHPSVILVVVQFHIRILNRPLLAATHLAVIYALTFVAASSMLVCVVRDPGRVTPTPDEQEDGSDSIGLTEALLQPAEDFEQPGKWCQACQAPKPERAHHCSQCERCVLKMDHHCPWLAHKCIGFRTYPSFVHFLCSVTLLSTYIAGFAIHALWFAFNNPDLVDESTGVHQLFLAADGIVFAMVVSTFAIYHLYLITTNQTTLENISPYMLLKYLPPLPSTLSNFSHLSVPPRDHELTYQQRYIVKDAHHHIRLYNVGWRGNWSQVVGWSKPWGWITRLLIGGASEGDGRVFPRNPRADIMLDRLVQALVKADAEA